MVFFVYLEAFLGGDSMVDCATVKTKNGDTHFFVGVKARRVRELKGKKPSMLVSLLENEKRMRVVRNPEKEGIRFDPDKAPGPQNTLTMSLCGVKYSPDAIVSVKNYSDDWEYFNALFCLMTCGKEYEELGPYKIINQ